MMDENETWTYMKNGKKYLEWRYAAKKALQSIARIRYSETRFHHDKDCSQKSDKHYVECLRIDIKRYFSFLAERDNPIEVK